MVGAEDFDAFVIEEFSSQFADGCFRVEQIMSSDRSPADDVFWIDGFYLCIEIFAAVRRFVRSRVAVPRRATSQDVADVDLFASQLAGFGDLVEQLPGFPDERFSLSVFVCARRLADVHDIGVGVANSEYGLRPGFCQFLTSGAGRDLLSDF